MPIEFLIFLIIFVYLTQVSFVLATHSFDLNLSKKFPIRNIKVWTRKQLMFRLIPFIGPIILVIGNVIKLWKDTPK